MNILKKIAVGIGVLIVALVAIVVVIYFSTTARMNETYDIDVETVDVPSDSASMERGRHMVDVLCRHCHGGDLGGSTFFDDPSLGSIPGSNITSGDGGLAGYTVIDWIRAIRHGVDKEGKPLMVMPSSDFYYLNNKDLGSIIAYMKTVPPVDKKWPDPDITFLGTMLSGLGQLGEVFSVENIDHDGPRPPIVSEAVSVEYGEYLVSLFGCRTCHGENLTGGKSPNPAAPPAAGITMGSIMSDWTLEDFIDATQTLESEYMPWEGLAVMTKDELAAIQMYLVSLPGDEE